MRGKTEAKPGRCPAQDPTELEVVGQRREE
jgi:hypothetical protein